MILFGSTGVSIAFMLIAMFLLGTWPNFFKYREKEVHKEYLFIIYVMVGLVVSIISALTLGTFGSYEPSFFDNLTNSDYTRVLSAVAGGLIIAVSNLLMVFAIEISGVAIAMPISSGISVVGGTLLNYAIAPVSHLWLLLIGIALIVLALIFGSISYMVKQKYQAAMGKIVTTPAGEPKEQLDLVQPADVKDKDIKDQAEVTKEAANKSKKGIIICVASGVIGCFWSPLSTFAMQHKGLEGTLTAYTCFFYFSIGFAVGGTLCNIYFIYRPLSKQPTTISGLFKLKPIFYLMGVIAGVLCAVGNALNFIAGASSGGFAVSYAIAQANTLVSGVYGIVLWKEYNNTNVLAKILYGLGGLCYAGAIVALAFSL